MTSRNGEAGIKLISVVLIVSGVLLLGIFVWLFIESARLSLVLVFVSLLMLLMPAWLMLTGIGLWKMKSWAFTSTTIMFISQMPVIVAPGLLYHFYTGLNLAVVFNLSEVKILGLQFNFGASYQIWFGGAVQGAALGLNVIPILMLIYLKRCRKAFESPPLSQINPASPDTPLPQS